MSLKDKFYDECKNNRQTPSIILRELILLYLQKGNEVFENEKMV